MRQRASQPIIHWAKRQRERQLTQTIRVLAAADVPRDYEQIAAASSSIFAKAQVLSCKRGYPVFVQMDSAIPSHRTSYWVHREVMPALVRWLQLRVFPAHEILG